MHLFTWHFVTSSFTTLNGFHSSSVSSTVWSEDASVHHFWTVRILNIYNQVYMTSFSPPTKMRGNYLSVCMGYVLFFCDGIVLKIALAWWFCETYKYHLLDTDIFSQTGSRGELANALVQFHICKCLKLWIETYLFILWSFFLFFTVIKMGSFFKVMFWFDWNFSCAIFLPIFAVVSFAACVKKIHKRQ